MTIKELKEKIAHLDDDMKVGGIGHYGEYLECFDVGVMEAFTKKISKFSWWNAEKELIFHISLESAGEEPL